MSSLELSKEMLAVKGYLGDARVIVEEQIGKGASPDTLAKIIIEVARMLQVERQHHPHKKLKPESPAPAPVLPRRLNSDSLMSTARKNPKLPPMVSADDDLPVQPKRSHTRKNPVEVNPRRVTPLSEGKNPRARKSKAEPKRKSSRRPRSA